VAALCVVLGALALLLRKPRVFLDKTRKRMRILDVRHVSPDTKIYKLCLGSRSSVLGLPNGKHVTIFAPNPKECLDSGLWNGKEDPDKGSKEIKRNYTPITGNETRGYMELIIKTYSPGTVKMPDGRVVEWADGGKMSRYLDSKKAGDFLEVSGPVGVHEYLGQGKFKVPGRALETGHICMMAGGAGITPILQVVRACLRDPKDKCSLTLIYANKTYDDILARDLLLAAEKASGGRFKIVYTLDFPPEAWQGKTGFITAEMIQETFVAPSENPVMLMCGPPPMIEFACKKNLEKLGYPKTTWIAM
jgi:cytochrome-b5 reductase